MCEYGNAYVLPGPNAEKLGEIFHRICKENDIMSDPNECFAFMNELPEKDTQLSVFDMI